MIEDNHSVASISAVANKHLHVALLTAVVDA